MKTTYYMLYPSDIDRGVQAQYHFVNNVWSDTNPDSSISRPKIEVEHEENLSMDEIRGRYVFD